MYKFVLLSVVALVASVSGAPGGLVVPVVAASPAVAVAHPVHVSSSYSSGTLRAPVVKAVPVLAAAPTHHVVHTSPVVAAPLVAAHPIVKTTHQVVAHPSHTIVKTAPLIAHTPVVHAAPVAAVHALPVTGYANHYSAVPIVKTHHAIAPVTLVH